MLKKIFWISLGFFLLTLVFLGVYEFAFKHNTLNPVADPEKKAQSTKKEIASEEDIARTLAFENFLSEPIAFPGTEANHLFYYSTRDRQLKRISYDQKETGILMRQLSGEVKRLVWSPLYTSALALLEQDGKMLWHYLDFRNQTQLPLKPEMSRLSWNTLGDSIFYQFTDPGTGATSLNMANFDGSNWKKLVDLEKGDYFLTAIPQSSRLAFWNKPDGFTEGRLESLSMTGDGRKVIVTGKFGSDYLWSPDGHTVLVGNTESKGSPVPVIGIVDENGNNYRDLRIPTLINKIVWSRDNQTLYYAQPGAFPSGTILPNDYYGKPLFTQDTFWKVNIKTGKRERLIPLNEMNQAFDATSLFLAPDETSLFFIDRESSKLYRISL